jgi:transcriptional regulator with XRE-family HTH domain
LKRQSDAVFSIPCFDYWNTAADYPCFFHIHCQWIVKKFIASTSGDVTIAVSLTTMTASFGQLLSAAREKRGLSLEDAAHETRIPMQRLRYLESGNIAAFGSLTYARSFLRQYSEFLGVDASEMLEELPEGVLGGERDYRYLTQSQGQWLRENDMQAERITAPAAGRRVRSIKSPLPAALAVFVFILIGTAMWGKHVADLHNQVDPAAMKALPVEDDEPPVPAPATTAAGKVEMANVKPKQVDFPPTLPKVTPAN